MILLEYITWWLPILCLSAPIIWAILYHNWYKYYKERKQEESWARINAFFAKHGDEYPEAAASWGLANFLRSPEGYDVIYQMKKAEYKARISG